MVRAVLAIAAAVLPTTHRRRWREEMAALLFDVDGNRRWRYLVDAVLKVPILVWQLRGRPPSAAGAAASLVAGAGLLLAAAAVVTALVVPEGAEVLLVLAPVALAAAVIRDTAGSSAGRATKAAVICLGALGPLLGAGLGAVEAIAPPALSPLLTLLGHAALTGPAVWLLARSVLWLRDAQGPPVLHATGILAGSTFVVLMSGLVWQMLAGGAVPFVAVFLMAVSLPVFLLSFVGWTVWAGLRIMSAAFST